MIYGKDEKHVRLIENFYQLDCQVFRNINSFYNYPRLNSFLQVITHLGGARFTIFSVVLLILFSVGSIQMLAVASALALALSHLPVALMKKLYPRKRPYLVLDQIQVSPNPLKDHSFPSGHTTAIFSIITPFLLYYPALAFLFLPIATCVGLSRIFLGLHYPSDVLIGSILGMLTGTSVFLLMKSLFPGIII